ncbi:MAG: winged helix-turn-helix domain-containing protein [Thermomicrobiales bacterium]
MTRSLPVAPHLSLEELRRLERTVPVGDRVRVLAVRLMAEGRPATEVSPLVGFSAEWVRLLVHRYNATGPEALGDGRRHNAGHVPLLDATQQAALRDALGGAAPDGGVWTCHSVAVWMTRAVGRPVSVPRAWVWMRKLGFTLQRPRPRETRASPETQEAWQKGACCPVCRDPGARPGPCGRAVDGR